MKNILQKEEKVLHQVTDPVPLENIPSPKIKKILKEMSASLKKQDDGVAIAAPQIGYPLRIFVISGKIFSKDFMLNKEGGIKEPPRPSDTPPSQGEKKIKPASPTIKDLVFINPKISKLSREKDWVPEGCLSVRWLYGKTYRSKKATVEAYDETGKKYKMGGSGLLAQIFQHETDHLNGILFTDHAREIKEELPPKEL